MEELQEMEEDAGLGNGGLGRLAGKEHTHTLYYASIHKYCCTFTCSIFNHPDISASSTSDFLALLSLIES